MEKISLLKWIKEDLDNKFKINANYWECNPIFKTLNLINETINVEIDLYVNEDAFLNGADPIKKRSYTVSLSGWDGIKEQFLLMIKNGVESMKDKIINNETLEIEEVDGFFNTTE